METEIVVEDLPLLIVDDDVTVLRTLHRVLTAQGYELVLAEAPEAALDALLEEEFAAIICDYQMPTMDGVQFLTKALDHAPNTERILLTAHADEEALERGINHAQIHRLMRKPWRADALKSVVADAVRQNRLRREHAILLERVRARNAELSQLNRLLSDHVAESDREIRWIRRRWDAAFNAISDPVTIINPDLRIEACNQAAIQSARLPQSELEGQACHRALFGRETPCEACPALGGSGKVMGERDGCQVVFDVHAYGLPGGDAAQICVYRDITDKLAFERDASHIEKLAASGRLAGGVAHELNNPLHAILTFVQLAQKPATPADKLDRYHQVIRESAARCRDIIESLRIFSRRDANVEFEAVDLKRVCQKALVLFRAVRDRRFERDAAVDGPIFVLGNASQLQQVVINLLQNAVDASPSEGLIRIGLTSQDDLAVLSVEDGGCGVPESEREKIFEPFFTTKPEGVGTGLGLAISHRIIREHEGSLRVRDSSLGGARFEARLRMLTHDHTPR